MIPETNGWRGDNVRETVGYVGLVFLRPLLRGGHRDNVRETVGYVGSG